MNEMAAWVSYLEQNLGFVLPKRQHKWLQNAVNKTAQNANLTNDELFGRIKTDDTLRQNFFDLVLVAESRFFRDKNVVDFVNKCYQHHHSEHFSVLSVGCSTGQEVWSQVLALYFQQTKTNKAKSFEVVGIDASSKSLEYAKNAHYPALTKSQIPPQYHLWLKNKAENWSVDDALKQHAKFMLCNVFLASSLNQAVASLPNKRFEVIICQNMLIYFRKFDQRDILDRLVSLLDVGGFLVLGAGEAIFWEHGLMVRIPDPFVNVWQKR